MIPSFSAPAWNLMTTATPVGPFVGGVPASVPIWLALQLRETEKATIQPPRWMAVGELRAVLAQEQAEPQFAQLPFYWLEVSTILLRRAARDVPAISTVRTLLEDLANVRMAKIRTGLLTLEAASNATGLTGLGAAEVCAVRGFLTTGLDKFREVHRRATAIEEEALAAARARGSSQGGYRSSLPARYRTGYSQSQSPSQASPSSSASGSQSASQSASQSTSQL